VHIIPVIDLMHGQVVQAIQGQRQHYRPIQSQLTDSAALLDVVAAILQVYTFDCLYIADLNAITGHPPHLKLVQQAMASFPSLQWWVDGGFNHSASMQPWLDIGVRPIIASETVPDIETYQSMQKTAAEGVLSLDFFQDGFHGPARLETEPSLWTQPTILMSLPKVGANQGPEIEKMTLIKRKHPQQTLYAAGGVRHQADIQALANAGAEGVLIASALHQKKITTADLRSIAP
jgi:phosphoribosylformimino-5-aminoimidazole carboxamide ribotide isomerase